MKCKRIFLSHYFYLLISLTSVVLSTVFLAQTTKSSITEDNSENVILIGYCETPGNAKSVAVKGLYAYVTDTKEGLRIISLKNPFKPKEVGSIKFSQVALDVKIKGKLAYVSVNQGLRIVDISNSRKPRQIGSFDIQGYAEGLDLQNNLVYLTDAPGNLKIIDVSNPFYPLEIGNYSKLVFPSDVEVEKNHAFVADEISLQVINIENPAKPKFTDKFETFADHLDIRMNYLYLADYHDYLKIFDISNPTHINLVSQFKTPSWPADVSASRNFVYVADSPAGMRTIDISNPYFPKEVGYYDNETIRATGITSFGRVIFVAGGDKLYILFNTVNSWGLRKNNPELERLIINKLKSSKLLAKFTLYQNYPNPFNPTTTIKYSIPSSVISRSGTTRNLNDSKISPTGRNDYVNVILKVYDILGREVTTLVNEKQKPGFYEVAWDASKHPSGVYFYKLTTGDYVETKKMILLR